MKRMVPDLDARPKKAAPKEIDDDAYTGFFETFGGGRTVAWI